MAPFTALRRLPAMSVSVSIISKSPGRGAHPRIQQELCGGGYHCDAWAQAVGSQDTSVMTQVSLGT